MKAQISGSLVAILAAVSGFPSVARAEQGPARPNILFVIFDDWGWQHAYLELAGLKPPPPMTGRSLVRLLRSEKSGWPEGESKRCHEG